MTRILKFHQSACPCEPRHRVPYSFTPSKGLPACSGDQCIDLGLPGPSAPRIIPPENFEIRFQLPGIMARLELRHAEVILGLRGCIRFRVENQKFLKALDGVLELVEVEACLPFPENHLTAEVIGRQETDEAMMFIAVGVKDDDGGSPLYVKAGDQGLVLHEIDLKGNEALLDRKTDVGIGIGNSFQLLTPHSKPVVEIGQDQLLLFPRLRLGRCQGHLPPRSCHGPLLFRSWTAESRLPIDILFLFELFVKHLF